MTWDIIWGIARAILAGLGGLLVAKGYIDNGVLEQVLGAIGVVGSAVWSVVTKFKTPAV